MSLAETMERRAEEFKQRYTAIQEQIGRVIVVAHDNRCMEALSEVSRRC